MLQIRIFVTRQISNFLSKTFDSAAVLGWRLFPFLWRLGSERLCAFGWVLQHKHPRSIITHLAGAGGNLLKPSSLIWIQRCLSCIAAVMKLACSMAALVGSLIVLQLHVNTWRFLSMNSSWMAGCLWQSPRLHSHSAQYVWRFRNKAETLPHLNYAACCFFLEAFLFCFICVSWSLALGDAEPFSAQSLL